ncbi:FkbM family methyltransferase [Falsiruegeria mediterranea]|uniref:Methyltransferase FkbM domain-containing protein n=1 Tax=Falsiruegeria mediterranea M17 TaxID=1200281 RepID=A0A2R8CAX9_9RHOB|nr:FkbM family methyltransferase [Falsiruegeria mediterranea]SPJ29592.1 hypothetical protein TRM7615_03112 [Falsiruegeria mediterranea M17]
MVKGKPEAKSLENPAIITANYMGNTVLFEKDGSLDYIEAEVERTGSFYELELLHDIWSRFLNGGTFIDVGAHIGNHSLFFSKVVKPDRVLSFEAQPGTYEKLLRNISINDLRPEDIKAFRSVVGSYDTKYATLNQLHEGNPGATSVEFLREKTKNSYKVYALDDFDIKDVSLVKIDVEGAEVEVLKGAARTILNFKPHIYVEAERENLREVVGWMNARDYRLIRRFNHTPTYLFSHLGKPALREFF